MIKLDEQKNQYLNTETGLYHQRVNNVIKSFGNEFPKEMMAPLVAKKRKRIAEAKAKKMGVSTSTILMQFPKYKRGITKEQVLQEWDEESKEALYYGSLIHNANEDYNTKGIIPKEALSFSKYLEFSKNICSTYKDVVFEKRVAFHNSHIGIAGSIDELMVRYGGGYKQDEVTRPIIDLSDTKCNIEKFGFDSTGEDFYDKSTTHRKNFYSGPIDHLEECYYNQTALQLSFYAYMVEKDYKVGKLFAKLTSWRKPETDPVIIPIPYLRSEVEKIIDYLTIKKVGHVNAF